MHFISKLFLKNDENSSNFSLSRKKKRQIKAQFGLRSLRLGPPDARGSFGVMAIGIARKDEQKYAVKLIEPKQKDAEYRATAWREDVQREAHFLSTLRHENIVEFFDSHMICKRKQQKGVKVPRLFALKCELLVNKIRSLFWGSGTESEEQQFRLFARQIGGAIEFMHSRHIVHHDIKVENILHKDLPSGELIFKLIDFGLAKHYDQPLEANNFFGTKFYFCSQKLKKVPYNPYLSDVYAFGLTLAQCKIGFGFVSWGLQPIQFKNALIEENQRMDLSIPYVQTICDMMSEEENDRPCIGEVVHLFQ